MTPNFEPQAHNHIDDVIALTQALIDLDRAAIREGAEFFPGFAVVECAGMSRAGAERLMVDSGECPDQLVREDVLDAAVWKRSVGDEAVWESP